MILFLHCCSRQNNKKNGLSISYLSADSVANSANGWALGVCGVGIFDLFLISSYARSIAITFICNCLRLFPVANMRRFAPALIYRMCCDTLSIGAIILCAMFDVVFVSITGAGTFDCTAQTSDCLLFGL